MQRFPRVELQDLIRELGELPSGFVVWSGDRLPFTGQIGGKPGWWVELSIRATATKGVDDYRQTYSPLKECNSSLAVGYRIYTMTVRVKSNSSEDPSFDLLEMIRLRMRSLTAKKALQQANLALIDFHPSVDMPVAEDNRTTTESLFEVRLGWLVTEDFGDDDGGIIDTVGRIENKLTP